MENLLVPNHSVHSIPGTCALVFAPHPDDEVLGCGGAIMRHVEQGTKVHVIIVTDGAYGVGDDQATGYILQRRNESIAAAQVLGYGEPIFWSYQDRRLRYDEKLIEEILAALHQTGADLVYAPSVFEMHPDHRMLAMAVVEAVRRTSSDAGKGIRIALYEVGIPLQPNLLLDISDVMPRKMAAMSCFVSQNTKQRYDLHIAALNQYRTYTLSPQTTAAEAYLLVSAEELADDPLKLYQSEHTRQKMLGLPLDSRDLPLVSVIIRSIDRETLAEALDSIALQTYPNIEVVLVNAKGIGHRETGAWCGRFPLRMISDSQPFTRSRSANAGLQAAHGTYLIFLDDDDLFFPEHIAVLVIALQSQPSARCAYSGVKVDFYVNGRHETSAEFNEPYDQHRLWGRNFIPIHAMLFERSLVTEQQCSFDETLAVFEDWDFWIQLSQHSPILHVNKITAVYRNHGHSQLGYHQDKSFVRNARGAVFEKWNKTLSGAQLDDIIEYRENTIADLRLQLLDKERLINTLQDHIQRDTQVHTQYQQEISQLNHIIDNLNGTIQAIFQSTSWKITAPMRFFIRIARGQRHEAWDGFQRRILPLLERAISFLPTRWQQKISTIIHQGTKKYFVNTKYNTAEHSRSSNDIDQLSIDGKGSLVDLVDISTVKPLITNPGRIAVHAHLYYADLAPEFAGFLQNMPYPFDLYVSVTDAVSQQQCQQIFSRLANLTKLTVTITPNRGRDWAPFLCTFGNTLQQYDYIAHIHSKKSLYNHGETDGWREYLLTSLFGSTLQIQQIFTLLTRDKIGLIYPQNFANLPYFANCWLSNKAQGSYWCHQLGINNVPPGYFDFPAGSMFWARTQVLQPLFNATIALEDFPEEAGQTDGTLAHCLERLPVLITRRSGHNAIILHNKASNHWSRWCYEIYVTRRPETAREALADPGVRIVIFDIFDTLLTRPLLNPEAIKTIVAYKSGRDLGKQYLEWRATAETQARQKAGHDVGLDAIFTELTASSGLSPEITQQLRDLEETIEYKIVSPRLEIIDLLRTAIGLGKRIILASDMYLPKPVIEKMLKLHGVEGWHEFYLSSETGWRKDTGDFYRQLLIQKNAKPHEILMIGDNEHADLQIPSNLGFKHFHVMRAVELARGLPRLGAIIEQATFSQDIHQQLTLGMIVQKNFNAIFFPRFDATDLIPASPRAIGFSVVGPLILSFVQWLAKKAQADGIRCLHFLSREGQILKLVYDRWCAGMASSHKTPSQYLVLSRRAITVPMISNLEDVYAIARTRYHPNPLPTFIQERYGIILSDADCNDLAHRGSWSKNKWVSVENENIDHLKPVLQDLYARILQHAQAERPGLLAYLDSQQFGSNTSAIVDIGYAATVQGQLNALTHQAIHGYYLLTQKRAQAVESKYQVFARGCFGQSIDPAHHPNLPLIYLESFILEKLLSSDDAQVVCYRQTATGDAIPQFRPLAEKERQSATIRAEIRQGIFEFVEQAIAIRENIVEDFTIPLDVATTITHEFIAHISSSEKRILQSLLLDDHYCGRGLL